MSFDKIRSYWNNQPCNIKHSLKPFTTIEYFDEVEKKNILLNHIFLNLLILLNGKIKKF
jgi:hypothetical protein